MSRIFVIFASLVFGMTSVYADNVGEKDGRMNQNNPSISVVDGKFVDQQGRQVILHGVNIVEKNKANNYLSWHGLEEFAKMREWGFNCIRLGIIWDGVEPEPGQYDDEYLAALDRYIAWARDNGIYVILDMHQDLYSAKFGADGAPEWAVLDDGKPHTHYGGVWSVAYFTSQAIQTAFDNFWANKPASDGIGIQDHFARAWQHVAERYANEPTVIGYDLFNEPFPGSSIIPSTLARVKSGMEALAKKQGLPPPTDAEVLKAMMDLQELSKHADDMDVYRAYCEGGQTSVWEFESVVLDSFYRRVVNAIRQVDKKHIIFLETDIMCNAGTQSQIKPVVDDSGIRDPLQAFAPHAYDLVTDTDRAAEPNPERINYIFSQHNATSKRIQMPVLIGEWGALYGQPNTLNAAQIVVKQLEKYLFSDTYWSYTGKNEVEGAPYFRMLARPYPSNISGELVSYSSDLGSLSFVCLWKEDPEISAPTRIYLPIYWFDDSYSVDLEPEGDGYSIEQISGGGSSVYLVIPTTGRNIKRSLTVKELP